MKEIRTVDSEGQVLCHDLTQIIQGVRKGPAFKKGHVVTAEDIPLLLRMGKDHLFVWENDASKLHENDAAQILRELTQGRGLRATEPSEGKIDLIAEEDGMLVVDRSRLDAVNALGEMMIATRHGGFLVHADDKVAGMRIIPLTIDKEKMDRARAVAAGTPILSLASVKPKRYGVISTGNEIYHGRIEDTFTGVIEDKLAAFGCKMAMHTVLPDDHGRITEAIRAMLAEGMEMVLCTGGMSVDPDDRTPLAIRNTGAQVVSYGAPVLPGAMLLVAYAGDGRPIVGLPGCVMYARRTVLDLILPSLLSDTPITKEQLDGYGEGGLCLDCPVCTFPNCAFGR